jgi:hypothetical protein
MCDNRFSLPDQGIIPTMLKALSVAVLFLVAGCGQCIDCSEAADPIDSVSDIAVDETVVFFRTSGWLDEVNQQWHLPVHGWIYEPQESVVRLAAFEKLLDEKYGLVVNAETQDNFARRLNLIIADSERGKTIVIKLAGKKHTLPASAEDGHFESTIVISTEDAAKYGKNGLIAYSAVVGDAESRNFGGAIRLLDTDGISVISDIDDTVKVSNVGDHKNLLEQTFLQDFAAAPGMATVYREWSTDDTGFHFVSSSPWQLYEPLQEFLDQDGFPWSSFSLKSIRFRDETLLDLFKKGTETKPAAIEKILDQYPDRDFILVGDSGEQDPEVYAELLRSRPEQISKVYIRNVTQASKDDERFASVFDGIDADRWQLFENPEVLTLSSP